MALTSTSLPGMRLPRIAAGNGLPIEAHFGYSGALQTGAFVQIAGQLSRDSTGRQVPGDLARKTGVALDNMASLLGQYGLDLSSVIQVQVHVDCGAAGSVDVLRSVLAARLPLAGIALVIIGVAGLNDSDGMIEISAVARAKPDIRGVGMETSASGAANLPNSFASRLGAADVVWHGDHIYVSGQMPLDAEGRLLHAGDIAGQFGAAMDAVDRALKLAGSSLTRVLALDIFTTEPLTPQNFDSFCAQHRERMRDYRPTGTMVRVPDLPMAGALVSVSAVAAR